MTDPIKNLHSVRIVKNGIGCYYIQYKTYSTSAYEDYAGVYYSFEDAVRDRGRLIEEHLHWKKSQEINVVFGSEVIL